MQWDSPMRATNGCFYLFLYLNFCEFLEDNKAG